MYIENATLREIIQLIEEKGMTDKQISKDKGHSGNTVYNRLIALGATKSSGKWDFSPIKEEILDYDFWSLPTKTTKSDTMINFSLTEKEIISLKEMIHDYEERATNTESKNFELFGKLYFEQASYKNKSTNSKQLNIPLPEVSMQRLDDFINNASGLEKKFIVNKALEMFFDLYEVGLKKGTT